MRAVESDRIFDRKLQKEREAQDKVQETHRYCSFNVDTVFLKPAFRGCMSLF